MYVNAIVSLVYLTVIVAIKVKGFFRLHNVTVVGFHYLFNCYIYICT
jgi:hypothetical protein